MLSLFERVSDVERCKVNDHRKFHYISLKTIAMHITIKLTFKACGTEPTKNGIFIKCITSYYSSENWTCKSTMKLELSPISVVDRFLNMNAYQYAL